MLDWIGTIETTRTKYLRGASDLTIRSRLFLSMLRKRGRLEMNSSGLNCRWQVEYDQPPVYMATDAATQEFAQHNAYKHVSHDWRGYQANGVLSKLQRAVNRGDEQLIDDFSTITTRMTKSVKDALCGEMYKDGSAADRTSAIHGLETFLTAGTVASGDRIALAADTYGEEAHSTAAGTYGTWTAAGGTYPNSTLAKDWPNGQGTANFDWLTPKLVNYSSTAWGTNLTTWEANCWRVISQTIQWLTTTGGDDGMPHIVLLDGALYHGYKNHQEAKTRINLPHQAASDLGFGGNTLNHDGVAITSDFDCPVNTGYVLNLEQITLKSLFPDLLWMEGPEKDPRSNWSWLWSVGFFGNACYQPKHVGKIYPYA